MTSVDPSESAGPPAHDAPVHIGAVALRVSDVEAMARFYEDAIGLTRLGFDGEALALGVDGATLVRLVGGAGPARSQAGLFHLALVAPDRAALAAWLAHAGSAGVRLDGASDHRVSEALYLSDPEGNGIEIYRDRPRAEWPRKDGAIAMATDRLDLDALLRDADGAPWRGLRPGTRMGHVHLRVGDAVEAERFYGEALGFETMVRYPGASFLSTGGYHHHIAVNVWHSRGAIPRAPGEAGLDHVELVATSPAAHRDLAARLLAAGGGETDLGPAVADPWGNRMVLRPDQPIPSNRALEM